MPLFVGRRLEMEALLLGLCNLNVEALEVIDVELGAGAARWVLTSGRDGAKRGV